MALDGSARRSRWPPSSGSRTARARLRPARSLAPVRRARASIGPRRRRAACSSLSANQIGVLRGFVSAYSQNDVAGTMQRLPLPEPSPPVRALHVADVRDRLAAELRRPGHAPSGHDELALAVCADADDRRHLVGEDRRQRRQVASAIVLAAKRSRIADWPLVTL